MPLGCTWSVSFGFHSMVTSPFLRSLFSMVSFSVKCHVEKASSIFYSNGVGKLDIKTNYDNPESLDAIVIAHGAIVAEAIKASSLLKNMKLGIILAERIMPYNKLVDDIIKVLPQKSIPIVTLEEEIKAGGFGMMLFDKLYEHEIMTNKKTSIMATSDSFADKYGNNIYAIARRRRRRAEPAPGSEAGQECAFSWCFLSVSEIQVEYLLGLLPLYYISAKKSIGCREKVPKGGKWEIPTLAGGDQRLN